MIVSEKKQKITKPEDIFKIMRAVYETQDEIENNKEQVYTVGVNSRNVIQYIDLTHIGTLTESIIAPRDVFARAIQKDVNSIILVHNHPSNNVTPSEHDIQVTDKLKKGADLLNINLLDHIIIGDDDFFSMKAGGLIK